MLAVCNDPVSFAQLLPHNTTPLSFSGKERKFHADRTKQFLSIHFFSQNVLAFCWEGLPVCVPSLAGLAAAWVLAGEAELVVVG